MQTLNRQLKVIQIQHTAKHFGFFPKLLLSAIACAVVVLIGPTVLGTIANASFVMLQIAVDLLRVCVPVFHAFAA